MIRELWEEITRLSTRLVQNHDDNETRDDDGIQVESIYRRNPAPVNMPPKRISTTMKTTLKGCLGKMARLVEDVPNDEVLDGEVLGVMAEGIEVLKERALDLEEMPVVMLVIEVGIEDNQCTKIMVGRNLVNTG